MEKYGGIGQAADDNTIWCMRLARWVTKSIDTHSEYVLLITCPRRNLLSEGALISRYNLFTCLVVGIM